MKSPITYLIFFLAIFLWKCSSDNSETKNKVIKEDSTNYIEDNSGKSYIPKNEVTEDETRKIKDGVYTADIEYYNTSTGVNTLYVTKVHVEDGYLKVIKWPSGVWLASELFKPQKIQNDGTCIIKNIDAGYENRVKILDLIYY
ncbi:MAG: hypothetical protein LC105_10675 [Chitinophagales bacterium]|nr:hypothetical protein [Chitinophagales bacterium]MCZ2394313.1 hypothetical protein [Chitinophagales bacterium]